MAAYGRGNRTTTGHARSDTCPGHDRTDIGARSQLAQGQRFNLPDNITGHVARPDRTDNTPLKGVSCPVVRCDSLTVQTDPRGTP
jgi:hypothetical protein